MREKTTERRQKDEFAVLEKTSSPIHFKGDEPDQEALVCPTGCSSRALLLLTLEARPNLLQERKEERMS